jgi:hypothetical protein
MSQSLIRLTILSGVFCVVTACSKGGRNGGTSTDVGGGGSGIEAVWKQYATDLEQEIRLLVATPVKVDPAEFDRIKAALPSIIHSAKLKIVGYPLLLGVETSERDNPLGAAFTNPEACSNVTVEEYKAKQRDAINFPSIALIKVSEPRLLCYIAKPDQMRKLILHEYLGLLGYPEVNEAGETDYRITNAILEAMRGIQKFEDGLEVIWVRSCEDFDRIGETSLISTVPRINYKFAQDIECEESEARKANREFQQAKYLNANIDGNGYAIYGINRKGSALFADDCSHCTIANLRIDNAYVEGESILLTRNSGRIVNVAVIGKLKVNFSAQASGRGTYEAGGLVRENFGVINGLNAMIEVDGTEKGGGPEQERIWLGGIAGSNFGNISHSNARIVISGAGNLGGFTGWNSGSANAIAVRLLMEGTGAASAGGFSAYNEGRVERVLSEGTIRILDAAAAKIPVAGLIAVARSKDSKGFPFQVGHTSADVLICGPQLNAAPLIADYDGSEDVHDNVVAPWGTVYDSYGYGKVSDTCAAAHP